jgi:predicted DNA-binding transcriptional regulator AlpA
MPDQANHLTDPDALSIRQFCERHNISQSFYFKLQAQGRGPRTLKIGARRLISREDARTWRKQQTTA